MNLSAASPFDCAPARPSRAVWKEYALFTLCASLYLLPFLRVIVTRDEGSLLTGAVRITQGQVFARDFFEVMGPGTFYWLAAFFKLFGISFMASRICLFISSLGTALALYFLSRQLCRQSRALPALILAATYFGGLWPEISHHVDSNFFGLLSVACLVAWNARRHSGFLIAAGLLIGATTCIYQPKGALLLLASLAWLWFQRKSTSTPLAVLALLAGSCFAVVALVLVYFWSQGALGSLAYANFIFPRYNYGAVNSVPYATDLLHYYWSPWFKAFGGGIAAIAPAAILITPLAFVAALPLFLLLVAMRCKWKSIPPLLALYWLCGWAIWFAEFHRRDIDHLVFGSPLLILLCIHTLTEIRGKLAHAALQILAICAVCLASFNCCVVLFAGAHTTETRVGRAALIGKGPDRVLRFLDEHLSPGEAIFSYPYFPTYYFLSAANNPTRYSILMYNYNTPAQFREVVSVLEQRRVRYVIWETTFAEQAENDFPGMIPNNPADLILEPYLESHFKQVENDDGIRIMERK
jgi:4-amino-4-deoxy-L-arabinose transferase-like glycosyltransferase